MTASASPLASTAPSKFQARNYEKLIGMEGFSEKLLRTHFKLYEGYVTNTNTFLEELNAALKEDKEKQPKSNELRRRLGWEYNGMRLHEYYFDNLGGKAPLESKSHLAEMINAQFGSFDLWKKEFVATGAQRGIGWAILYHDVVGNRLTNFWIEEHNTNHLAGGAPILIMDVFEHAFMLDYGTDRAKYIESFFKNIDWQVAAQRCEAAARQSK